MSVSIDTISLCTVHFIPPCPYNVSGRERSGRVLDSRPRGRGIEPHQRHCVVVLEQDIFTLANNWFNPRRPVPV